MVVINLFSKGWLSCFVWWTEHYPLPLSGKRFLFYFIFPFDYLKLKIWILCNTVIKYVIFLFKILCCLSQSFGLIFYLSMVVFLSNQDDVQ